MKIAIPTDNDVLSPHFGHCSVFTIIDVDPETRQLLQIQQMTPPPHERGVIPAWLHELGCTHILAGGMGWRAVSLFQEHGVAVISGVPKIKPEDAVGAFLRGDLSTGANPCDDPEFRLHTHGEGHCRNSEHHHE